MQDEILKQSIFLRCHTSVERNPKPAPSGKKERQWPEHVLIFDTETTINAEQSLTFGSYVFCRENLDGIYETIEEGIFHADDVVPSDIRKLEAYAAKVKATVAGKHSDKLKLHSRDSFMERVFLPAVQANAAIVAFNLPFDLSRIAVEYRAGRRANGRAWSFVMFQYLDKTTGKLRPNTFRPRVQLSPKDSKAAFVRLAGGDMQQPFKPGRFLDVKTLVWALRNRSMSLDGACKEFGVPGKLDHQPTGTICNEEIDYCRGDVRATLALLNALRAEYSRYPIDLRPERAYSAASIAKSFLRKMNLTPPAEQFQLTDKVQGICMQAYYGGRAEIRIRHTSVPVVYTDFLSQYPTVNTLLGMWDVLTAIELRTVDATEDVNELLEGLTLQKLFDPKTWRQLGFFVLIQPDDDVLPVRTVYGNGANGNETNIGVNPLTSNKPIWFAGPDVVGSLLLSGKKPNVIRAIRFEAVGKQPKMQPVELGPMTINPYKDNFFTKVIEQRKSKATPKSLQYFLKILANAGCYGIYAEVNRTQTGKNDARELHVHSGEHESTQHTCVFEQPGDWFLPPMAALTTAGGRLLLTMLEKAVTDLGGHYLMCDTDSMAIVATELGGPVECEGGLLRKNEAIKALSWKQVDQIAARFEALNPYDRKVIPGSILKIEDVNFDKAGKRRQVFGYGVSAKRYALFEITRKGDPVVVKPSEHGLGLYFRPKEGRNADSGAPEWIQEGWQWIVESALGRNPKRPRWFDLPVMRRIGISTPHVMGSLRKLDPKRARPYNFALSPVLVNLSGQTITLLAPFEKDSTKWNGMTFINAHDGTLVKLDDPSIPLLAQTFEMVFRQYTRHPEAKSLGPDGRSCVPNTRGLLKRFPVHATGFQYVGKETERGWEDAEDVSTLMPNLVSYGEKSVSSKVQEFVLRSSLAELQKQTGLSRHTLINVRRGKKVHSRTLDVLRRASLVID